MSSIIIISLLILQISYSEHSVCYSNDPPTLVKISQLPTKQNNAYHFKINNYANAVTIVRNNNGTFLHGDFSTIILSGQKKEYQYISTSLSFKYPPQNRIVQVGTEIIQLQITYQLNQKDHSTWKHKKIALAVNFLMTEYAPLETLTIGKQINSQLRNGSVFDLNSFLPLITNLNMILYKGIHSDYPNEPNFLWLIRRELLLMSQTEFYDLKSFIFQHLSKDQIHHHGLLQRLSDLNEIGVVQNKEIIISNE